MGASKVDGKIYGENSKFYGLKMFEKRMGGKYDERHISTKFFIGGSRRQFM